MPQAQTVRRPSKTCCSGNPAATKLLQWKQPLPFGFIVQFCVSAKKTMPCLTNLPRRGCVPFLPFAAQFSTALWWRWMTRLFFSMSLASRYFSAEPKQRTQYLF